MPGSIVKTLPTPPAPASRWLLAARILGFGVVLLSLRWIVLRLGADGAELASFRPSPGFLALAALAVPLWSSVGLVPASAWARLLEVLAGDYADRRRDVRIFARLQISKYLPGHAFQVARHAVTRSAGRGEGVWERRDSVPHTALGAAATCEALGMITAAAALAFVAFGLAVSVGAVGLGFELPRPVLVGVPVIAVGMALTIPWLLSRLAGSRWLPGVVPHESRALLPSFGLYAIEKALAGLILGSLLATTSDQALVACLLAATAAYPLAWLTGFLTPATPAGAGAVEAVLVAILGSRYGAVEVLAAAVGLRLVMVAGDALLALAAYMTRDAAPLGEPAR
ncbi:MAG: hypothetical protein MPN21_01170 [Thermoanaerobaculia bacterium]|nr:hypothetical protein [Thermoanaerobaculia bacterium]